MKRIDRDRIRKALTGPIASVRPPFRRDGSIDERGLTRALEFNIEAGTGTLLLTYGDSHYDIMTDREVEYMTRLTVRQAAGRALVVAADRNCGTPAAVKFARYCRGLGADVLMIKPPDWGHSATPESLAAHYKAVAREIPVMLVTNMFGPRGHEFGMRTMELVRKGVPGVVAVKDDIRGQFARNMTRRFHGDWAIFAGGQKQSHWDLRSCGACGYLSTFVTFKPEVAWRYWNAIQAGRLPEAEKVIRDIDKPFFDLIMKMPGGFDAGIHGVLELAGICGRWRRSPHHSLSGPEMDRLAKGLAKLGIL